MMTNGTTNGVFNPWANGFGSSPFACPPSNGFCGPQSFFNGCAPWAPFGGTAPGAWSSGFGAGFGGGVGGQYAGSTFGPGFSNGYSNAFNPVASAMWAWYQNNLCGNPADCTCTPGNTTCFTMPGASAAPFAYPFGASNFSGGTPWNFGMNGGMNCGANGYTMQNGFSGSFPYANSFGTGGFNTPYSYCPPNCNPWSYYGGGWNGLSNGFANSPASFAPTYANWCGSPSYAPGFNGFSAGFNAPAFNSGFQPAYSASFNPWWSAASVCTPNFNGFYPGAQAYPATPWNTTQAHEAARPQTACANGTMNLKRDAA